MTVRGRRAVKDCPTGPSAASRPAESLTAIGDRAPLCRQGGKLDIGAFARRLVTASVLCQAGTGPGWLLLPGGAMELSGWSTGEVAGARRALPRGAPQLKTALACIIGARRACTVEMISSGEIPCR